MIVEINKKILKNIKILNFDIISEMNKHTKINIYLELLENISINVYDEICFKDENDIFCGYITEYLIQNYNKDYKKIKIEAYSYSILLDKNKSYRIYQDENITYYDIISDIMSNYKIKYNVADSLKLKINRIYLQYNETDFHFITRILNDIKEVVYTSYRGLLVIGYQNLSSVEFKNIYMQGFRNNKSIFEIENEIYLVGDIYNNQYICKIFASIDKGIFKTNIELCNKNDYETLIINQIQGLHLEANVVEINANENIAKMKVDFNCSIEDKSKNKKKLSFATPYSKSHTGFYVSPEINDRVEVYFPTNNENDAKVSFCINNENSIRFCDYNNRNFNTEYVSIDIKEGKLDINTKDITLQASNSINNISASYIAFESKKESSIFASSINIVSKEKDIELNSKRNISLKADKIYNN